MSTQSTSLDRETLSGDYTFDTAHTTLGFVARHAMVTRVRGSFGDYEGSARLDFADPSRSSVRVKIQATSIDTGNADRDTHLRSNDFFAMDEYPEIRFQSTSIEPLDEQSYRVSGDLTIRGITKPITFESEYVGAVVDPWGNIRVGFSGSVTVNRKEWGLEWNAPLEAGGVLVSESVTLEFDVSAIKTS